MDEERQRMPLFRDRPVRTTVLLGVALAVGWGITKVMNSIHAFHLTQTSIAMLAIAALMFLITLQHRREAHLLTQTQEEMALIAGFGLFWVAALLGWRALTGGGGGGGERGAVSSPRAAARGGGYVGGEVPPYPCSSNSYYCVQEEYWF